MEQICCFGINLPHEPASMEEALAGDDREAWLASREDEFRSHMENETWTLTNLAPGRKALDCTWVLRVKTDAEGRLERRKTRLVIKGFQQTEGIDFQEVFAPVAKAPTLRLLLAAAALCGWKVEQMDVKTAFLYGVVEEEIYMKQPEEYDDGIGRLHQQVEALEALGFKVSGCDESLFMTEREEEKVFLLVYVDDILLFSPSLERIKEVQGKLKETFQCKALGPVGYYLGLHVERDEVKGWLRLHQHKYLAAMWEKYGLEEGRSVKTPLPSGFQLHLDEEEGEVLEYELQRRFQSMVGSLMYASVNTRPDIAFSVSQLAHVVSRPLQEHLDAAERLVRAVLLCSWVNMEAEGSAPAGPSGSGGVRGAGEAGRGVVGGSAPITSVSTPAKHDVKAFNLEKFSGVDWASWSFRLELLFNHYGLLEVMDGELKRPASEGATKEWDRRSKDGFFLLSQCLSSNQLHHFKHLIKDIHCGPKAWKILKDVHAPSSEAMVVVLERQLHAVKINEGDAVQGAFDQLRDLYVKLSAAGVDYPEKIKCYKALSLLPESWGPLVVNLNGIKDSWSLEWIRAQVVQDEFRRKELTAAAGEGGGSAYDMKGFKGRGSKKCKAKEGSGGEQYSGGKRSNKGGKRCDGKCWYCHVEGHPWFKCRKLPDGWRPGQPSIEGSKGVHGAMGEGMGSEEGDGGAGGHGGMFYHVGEACSEDMVVPASKVALHRSSHWVIDTGAFMTMTNREDLVDKVRPSKAATVVSATGQVVPVRGEGRAMFMGADGRLVGLKRVLLVPGLCANILSTKALSEAGMKMEMMGTKVFKATLDGRVLWDL
ncbi:unnamed protein product [Closterium sp. NIES-54]